MFRSVRVAMLGLSFCFTVLFFGCGPAGKPSGKVAGEVLYKGQPIAKGNVTLHSRSTGVAATAKLENGRFVLDQPLAVGEYVVYVTPPRPEPTDPTKGPPPAVKSDIPMKARDLTTSGLTANVKTGENSLKIEIED